MIPRPAAGTDELRDLPAPAKLNLFLHIVGRRDDGMHLLQSLFVPIDWCDTMHFRLRKDTAVHRQDLGLALPAEDLSVRAARALQAASGTRLGVDMAIDKKVPWGAGLGGGSSDAATTLIALNQLWGLRLPRTELARLAATLGADLPFFIRGRPAFVEGIGERLTPVDLAPMRFVVVKPSAPLATADVFRHPAVVRNTPHVDPAAILAGFLAGGSGPVRDKGPMPPLAGHNDLQAAASALCPEVCAALDALQSRLGFARMSGSGSAVFAPIGEESVASGSSTATSSTGGFAPLGHLEEGWPQGWTVRVCRSLARHPLDAWLD